MSCKDNYCKQAEKTATPSGAPQEPTSEGTVCAKCGTPLIGGLCPNNGCETPPLDVKGVYTSLGNVYLKEMLDDSKDAGGDSDWPVWKNENGVSNVPPEVVKVFKKIQADPSLDMAAKSLVLTDLEYKAKSAQQKGKQKFDFTMPDGEKVSISLVPPKVSELLASYPEQWPAKVKKILGGLGIDSASAALITSTKDQTWMYLPRCPYCKHWVSPKTGICRYKKCPKYLSEVVEPTGWQWPPSAPSYTKFLHVAKKQDWLAQEKWQTRMAELDFSQYDKIIWSDPKAAAEAYEALVEEVEALAEMSRAVHGAKEFGPEWYAGVVDGVNGVLAKLPSQTAQMLAFQKGFLFPTLVKPFNLSLWLNPAYEKAQSKAEAVQAKAIQRFKELAEDNPAEADKVMADEAKLADLLKEATGASISVVDKYLYAEFTQSKKYGLSKFIELYDDLEAQGLFKFHLYDHQGGDIYAELWGIPSPHLYDHPWGYGKKLTQEQADKLLSLAREYLVPSLEGKKELTWKECSYLSKVWNVAKRYSSKAKEIDLPMNPRILALVYLDVIPQETAEKWYEQGQAVNQAISKNNDWSLPETWEKGFKAIKATRDMIETDLKSLPPYVQYIVSSGHEDYYSPYLHAYTVKGAGSLAAARKALLARGLGLPVNYASLDDILRYANGQIDGEELVKRAKEQRAANLVTKNKNEKVVAVLSDDNGVRIVFQQGDKLYTKEYTFDGKTKVGAFKSEVSEEGVQALLQASSNKFIHCPNCGRFMSLDKPCNYCYYKKAYHIYPVPSVQPKPSVQPAEPVVLPSFGPAAEVDDTEEDGAPVTPAPINAVQPSQAKPVQPKPQGAANLPKLNLNFGNLSGVTAQGNNFLAHLKQVQEMVQQKAKEGFGREIPLVNYATLTLKYIGDANLGGMHEKWLYRDQLGNPHLFKPDKHAGGAKAYAEKAAADVFIRIGLNAAPVDVQKGKDGLLCSVQPLVPGVKKLSGDPAQWKKEQVFDVARSSIGNWLISDHDGNEDNYLVTGRGTTFRCDMGQAFRYFPHDQLSTDYHPNAAYGAHEPVTNEMWKMIQGGALKVGADEMGPKMLEAVRAVEKISDEEYKSLVRPVAESCITGNTSQIGWYDAVRGSAQKRLGKASVTKKQVAEEFTRLALERKQRVRQDFETFLKQIYGNSFTFAKYED